MSGDLVLITGVTGHIGFRVLRYALEHGYAVRGAVRSDAKANMVRSNGALKAMQKDEQLSFVVVPDLTAAGAFDEAVKGVKYIIHCASPIPFGPPTTDNAYEDFIKPAVDSTLEMLRAAGKEEGVQRIVMTSSCIGVAPVAAAVSDTGEWYTADTRQPEPEGAFGPGTASFVAYAASKVSALNQAEAWMKENKPHFDIINLMPSYVIGRNDLYQTTGEMLASPNSFPLNIVRSTGDGETGLAGMAMVTNHIDDCARIHVEALDPKIEGGQSFMICQDCKTCPQWDKAKEVVEKRFPGAVKAGILPNKGHLEDVWTRLESEKTEKTFGLRYTYEDAVASAVEQYLELHEKEQAKNGGLKN